MLTLDLDDFMFELKEGALKHVGASNKAATVKLYDIENIDAREFGDKRIKVSCADDGGNEVELALDAAEAGELADRLETLQEESEVFD